MMLALGRAGWGGQGVHQVDSVPVEFSIARRMSICQCHNMRKERKKKERKERKEEGYYEGYHGTGEKAIT